MPPEKLYEKLKPFEERVAADIERDQHSRADDQDESLAAPLAGNDTCLPSRYPSTRSSKSAGCAMVVCGGGTAARTARDEVSGGVLVRLTQPPYGSAAKRPRELGFIH